MTQNKYFLTVLLPFLFLVALTGSRIALAVPENPPEFIDEHIETPQLVGQGQYHRLFWQIYEAGLYANQGIHQPEEDFALLLEYSRDLSGSAIVEKSIELIVAQGVDDPEKLEKWERFLDQVIPNVREGDQITGIRTANGAYFYFNGELRGQTSDADFSDYFFAIWLGEDTSAPDLRQALLGLNAGGNQQ